MYETEVDKLFKESKKRMDAALESVKHQFLTMRTGRAHPSLVEAIKVDYYGAKTALKQLANITTPDPRTISIHPWDKTALEAVEKAILASEVGISPVSDGKVLRLTMPQLTQERREELTKVLHRIAEEGKVSVRTARHDANEKSAKLEKDKKMTEDDKFTSKDKIQKLTDEVIKKIEEALSEKEKEILG